jgi:Mg2+-importing ATPase
VASAVGRLQPETDFEKGVRRFGLMMTQITLLIVVLIFPIGLILGRPLLESLLFSAALAVGLAPELLPAVVSVTLARGAQKLAGAGVLVRRLVAIENLGAMNVLCTDKTGTLTKGSVSLDLATDALGKQSDATLLWASINAGLQGGISNPLDDAIIAARPSPSTGRKLGEIPYDFERQRLSVLVERDGERLLICKGAVSSVTGRCSGYRNGSKLLPFNEAAVTRQQQRVAEWAQAGYRVLAVATKPMKDGEALSPASEGDLILEGYLLFSDPLKAGVAGVVGDLSRIGVRLKMITGDNRYVAQHVAQAAGIASDDILTGTVIAGMTDRTLHHRVVQADVFAEITPDQKERIVNALRRNGKVVGYLGDGINDAPALRAADLGISVDTALPAAKEAADVVLLKPDLNVLKDGIIVGRMAFANTLKYIAITTSANLGNMISMAVASLFLPFLPMLAKQILLNNALSDLPMLAISTDRVDDAVLKRAGRWDFRSLLRSMLVFGLLSSVFDFVTFGVLLFVFHTQESMFQTGWFVISLLTELVIILVMRTRGPAVASLPSRLLVSIGMLVFLVAVALPYLPFAGALGLVPLPIEVLAALAAILLVYGLASEALKRRGDRWPLKRRRGPREAATTRFRHP